MKTDAVVLLELIDELRTKHPASDKTTYTVLAAFQKGTKEINVISFINECCGRLREFIEIIPDTTEVHRNSFFQQSKILRTIFRYEIWEWPGGSFSIN